MSTVRQLAREAVIFMLLGPVVTGIAAFIYLKRQNAGDIKAEAARGVYAIDAAQEPAGFRPDNSVLVPLTNGMQLYVTDCAQAHPWVVVSETPADTPTKTVPIPAGSTNGSDCVYFANDLSQKYGGHIISVSLGNENQIAIEKEYWQAYVKAKGQHRTDSIVAAAVLSLWGFPGGFLLWVFYRLVRFAVKG